MAAADRPTAERPAAPEDRTRASTATNEAADERRTTPAERTTGGAAATAPVAPRREFLAVRGGLSLGSVITGVLVAFGAIVLLSAIIAGILAAISANNSVSRGDLVHGGIGGAIGVVVATFLAYLWGGYTAGRMARGLGAVNGFLVPVLAIIIGVIIGAIVYGLGANFDFANLNLPFNLSRITHTGNLAAWGVGLGIAALVAMFLGGIVGGGIGSRWHTRLERDAAADPGAARTRRV